MKKFLLVTMMVLASFAATARASADPISPVPGHGHTKIEGPSLPTPPDFPSPDDDPISPVPTGK